MFAQAQAIITFPFQVWAVSSWKTKWKWHFFLHVSAICCDAMSFGLNKTETEKSQESTRPLTTRFVDLDAFSVDAELLPCRACDQFMIVFPWRIICSVFYGQLPTNRSRSLQCKTNAKPTEKELLSCFHPRWFPPDEHQREKGHTNTKRGMEKDSENTPDPPNNISNLKLPELQCSPQNTKQLDNRQTNLSYH